MYLKCCILWKGNGALLRGADGTRAGRWGWLTKGCRKWKEVKSGQKGQWRQGKVLREEPGPGLHKAWQHQAAASCLFLFLPSQKNEKNPREYLSQDKSLLSWPRMLVRSNKPALPSAKSSVGISGGTKRAKGRGALPRDSNTKLKTQVYQDIAFPDGRDYGQVKPILSKVRVKGTLFKILILVLFWSQRLWPIPQVYQSIQSILFPDLYRQLLRHSLDVY